jgi:molybdopterin/thiamine biosynthesis adenylyltransferase
MSTMRAGTKEGTRALPDTLDTTRHNLIFDPHRIDKVRIDVIGCGAVGGRIAQELAKLLGSTHSHNLHVWDGDAIEPHNIANQPYAQREVGLNKAHALAAVVEADTFARPVVHDSFITGTVPLGNIVFLAVDTMKARKDIFQSCVHLRPTTQLVIEVRMGAKEYRVYAFNPQDRTEVRKWLDSLVDDADTVESACGTRQTVGVTAMATAAEAVQRFLIWYEDEVVRNPERNARPYFELIRMFDPPCLLVD